MKMLTRSELQQRSHEELEGIFEYLSMNSSTGVRFTPTKEALLDPALRTLAKSLPRANKGVAMMAEVPGPVGIPDLVALPAPGKDLTARLNSGIPPILHQSSIQVISALKIRQGISVSGLALKLEKTERSVSTTLRDLIRTKAARMDAGLAYRAPELIPVGRIYALEAKVDDWRKGVRQAFRYRAWCDASALVIGRMPKDPEPLMKAAERLNLGLACEDKWIIRPRISQNSSLNRLWGSEHFVAALGFNPTKSSQP